MGLWLRSTTPWQVEDLRPRGDALEYEETARNLVAGEGFCVVVDGGKYPSLYPFGFPLVLAGLFAVWDRGPGSGVVVVLATAVLTIAGVFRLASFAGREAAVVAALLLAASPAHVWWSRAVMSDVPAACAVVWILVGVVAAWRRDAGSLVWLALGAGIGLATSIRTAVALVAIPVAIAAVTHGTMATRLARLAALSGGLFLGLVPIFVYDQLRFGSPLRNGYDFWAPYPRFSWRFAFQPPRGGGTDPNLPFYLRALAGAGDLYPWPVAILIGLGLALGAWKTGPARRIAGLAGGLAILVVGMQSLFFWQGTRFLLLALPPLLAAAALPIAGPWALRAVALGLLLAASVSLVRTPQVYAPDQAFHEPTVLREIAAVMPPNAALLAHTNGPSSAASSVREAAIACGYRSGSTRRSSRSRGIA